MVTNLLAARQVLVTTPIGAGYLSYRIPPLQLIEPAVVLGPDLFTRKGALPPQARRPSEQLAKQPHFGSGYCNRVGRASSPHSIIMTVQVSSPQGSFGVWSPLGVVVRPFPHPRLHPTRPLQPPRGAELECPTEPPPTLQHLRRAEVALTTADGAGAPTQQQRRRRRLSPATLPASLAAGILQRR